jgi:hypothetical protein
VPSGRKTVGKWSGVNDGEPWAIEVEPDCMAESEPFTVSVWVGSTFTDDDVVGAFLSSEQAREVAATLMLAADSVDANNERVRRWREERK